MNNMAFNPDVKKKYPLSVTHGCKALIIDEISKVFENFDVPLNLAKRANFISHSSKEISRILNLI